MQTRDMSQKGDLCKFSGGCERCECVPTQDENARCEGLALFLLMLAIQFGGHMLGPQVPDDNVLLSMCCNFATLYPKQRDIAVLPDLLQGYSKPGMEAANIVLAPLADESRHFTVPSRQLGFRDNECACC